MSQSITVKISPTVTREQQQDPRFKKLHQETTNFLNSPAHFTKKYRSLLCLHEAGHVVYARRAGATDVGFHGPTLYWCSGCPHCPGDTPSISRSSVNWTFPPNCGVIAALKADIGGIVFREVLTDTPNDEAAVWSDMNSARRDYERLGDGNFLSAVEAARQEIIKDLESPQFRRLAWDTAKEFEQAIFPAPKLTSATLRAIRLAWR
jgi:hypothetical protein